MNLLQLKEVFDLNKNKTITLNDDYYIFIFNKYYTTISIYDNDILNYNEIAQIFYSDTGEVWLALAKEEIGITYIDKIEYSLTDSIDKLDLSPDLLEALKEKMYEESTTK